VWTLFHSYAFDFSVWEMWGALLYGGRLVVVPYEVSRTPEEFDRLLRDEGVTVLNQTPSAFRQLLRVEEARAGEEGGGWPALRTVIFGGEALDVGGLAGWFARHGDARPEMVNMYGITETTVHVTYRRLTAADAEAAGGGASPVGTGLGDLEVYLLDERMGPAAAGVGGELYVGGGGVARGYLNRPALTAERFVPHPFSAEPGARLYRTGDRARYRGQGELEFLGRADQQLKLRGYRIEAGEIEAALARHPLVAEAAVVPRGEGDSARLVAFYTLKGGDLAAGELREHARLLLPDYMVPAQFLRLERLPLTPSGKVDRRTLEQSAERETVSERLADPPGTPLELLLAEIWCELLDIDEVGVSQNFFELGGHSVLATQLISRLQDLFPTELPLLTMFFQDPTIRGLSKAILNNLKDEFDLERVMQTVQRVTELSDNEVEAMLVGDDGEGRALLLDSTAGD
jgi:acyl-coenzyme A synthetase/AMP-(fatty) acid ligase